MCDHEDCQVAIIKQQVIIAALATTQDRLYWVAGGAIGAGQFLQERRVQVGEFIDDMYCQAILGPVTIPDELRTLIDTAIAEMYRERGMLKE